jgi:hypothetical protein
MGVEAAIWAETISNFDDLCLLLLPRLAGVAHKAWSGPRVVTWTDIRDRLARHGRLWAQDSLTYFCTSTGSSMTWSRRARRGACPLCEPGVSRVCGVAPGRAGAQRRISR